MFACILILILFLPAAFLPCALNTFFSSRELSEMGVHLEDPQVEDFPQNDDIPTACLSLCI